MHRQEIQRCDRLELERWQLERLNALLETVLPDNRYYRDLFGYDRLAIRSLADWSRMPTSTKSDWLNDQASGLALHHTYPQSMYRRYHRTSGTRGKPMVILDTENDWKWWLSTWQYVLDACEMQASDRIMMAFSFGPFIGFWSAHDACLQRGCMVIPCGGMSTAARLDMIQSAEPTVLFSTPSYALHLAEDADNRGLDLTRSSIRQVFVAGERGGSDPAIRSRIEAAFGARVMDHAGATEVGPWGFGSRDGQAMHVIESEFIAEFLPVEHLENNASSHLNHALGDGVFELVLTSLGRQGAPVLRYRTGDLVRPAYRKDGDCNFVRLEGGVLGRADDMLVVRGVNIFPSSIEAIVHSFPEVKEYRLLVTKRGSMDELTLEIETADVRPPDTLLGLPKSGLPVLGLPESGLSESGLSESGLSEKLAVQLNLRFVVKRVPKGALPRSEGKARRVIDQR